MYSEKHIYTLLQRIEEAILLIEDQTKHFKCGNDFLVSSFGMFALGGVCMQLIFVGENVKVLSIKAPEVLQRQPEIPWNEIMGLRNIIVHEYHHVDADEIYNVIKNDLPPLPSAVLGVYIRRTYRWCICCVSAHQSSGF